MDKIEIGTDSGRTIFNCKKEHSWEGNKDVSGFSFHRPYDDSPEKPTVIASSGPLCPYCFCADMKERYGAVERGAAVAEILDEPRPDRFVLFAVYETSARGSDRHVGQVALLPSWSENDVMTELQARGYPTGGRVKFYDWPSACCFTLEIEKDELLRFRFEKLAERYDPETPRRHLGAKIG